VLRILSLESPLKKGSDLRIFTFNEPTNDQIFENIIQEAQIDKSFENCFEEELICLDESICFCQLHRS